MSILAWLWSALAMWHPDILTSWHPVLPVIHICIPIRTPITTDKGGAVSQITEVVLFVDVSGDQALESYFMTNSLDPEGRRQHLLKLDTESAGGTKVFCSMVYAAAFNYVHPSDVKTYLDKVPWNYHAARAIISWDGDCSIEVWSNNQ